MSENNKINDPAEERNDREIIVNEYGQTKEPAVVVDDPYRTVLVTEDETIVVDKVPEISVTPAHRPRKVYSGMWGTPEIAAFAVSILTLAAMLALYFFWVVPSSRELETNIARNERLKAELASAQAKYGDITDTESHVAKLVASAEDFEARFLPAATLGRTAIYQRLNGLIIGYGLINTSGPNYSPLEPLDVERVSQSEEESGRSRYRSLFPGVYITMTVEGPYQNIRRFMREIETGNEFVVISAVELSPSETRSGVPAQSNGIEGTSSDPMSGQLAPGIPLNPNQPRSPATAAPQVRPTPLQGRTLGATVSLRLEMAAYFRRGTYTPIGPAEPEPTPEPTPEAGSGTE
jgi:hypothetical protein